MKGNLRKARLLAATSPTLAEFDIRQEGEALHLTRKGDCFARLTPTGRPGTWCMAYFLNRERWKCIDFTGTLVECLELLKDKPHYLFWEG
jgi:hypothetical protein